MRNYEVGLEGTYLQTWSAGHCNFSIAAQMSLVVIARMPSGLLKEHEEEGQSCAWVASPLTQLA